MAFLELVWYFLDSQMTNLQDDNLQGLEGICGYPKIDETVSFCRSKKHI